LGKESLILKNTDHLALFDPFDFHEWNGSFFIKLMEHVRQCKEGLVKFALHDDFLKAS
jgi:hypothetical protein